MKRRSEGGSANLDRAGGWRLNQSAVLAKTCSASSERSHPDPLRTRHPGKMLRQHIRRGAGYQGWRLHLQQTFSAIRLERRGVGRAEGVPSLQKIHHPFMQAAAVIEVPVDASRLVPEMPREIPILIDSSAPQTAQMGTVRSRRNRRKVTLIKFLGFGIGSTADSRRRPPPSPGTDADVPIQRRTPRRCGSRKPPPAATSEHPAGPPRHRRTAPFAAAPAARGSEAPLPGVSGAITRKSGRKRSIRGKSASALLGEPCRSSAGAPRPATSKRTCRAPTRTIACFTATMPPSPKQTPRIRR